MMPYSHSTDSLRLIDEIPEENLIVKKLALLWADIVGTSKETEYPRSIGDVRAALESTGIKLSDELLSGFAALEKYPIADQEVLGAPFEAASILMARAVAMALPEMQCRWRSHIHAKLVFKHNLSFWQEFDRLARSGLEPESPDRGAWIRALGSVGETANDYEILVCSIDRPRFLALQRVWDSERWPRLIGQVLGRNRVERDLVHAAAWVTVNPAFGFLEYASSGVFPSRLEWGRRVL